MSESLHFRVNIKWPINMKICISVAFTEMVGCNAIRAAAVC